MLLPPTNMRGCERLEPYAGKLARTVLRGGGPSNGTSLPDRRFVNALVDAKKEPLLFATPKKEDLEKVSHWEKALDAITGLVVKSFSPDDCRVLARVLNGNSAVNIQKIDMIINHLNLIKKALLDNVSRQEVASLTQEGGTNAGLPIPMQ